MVVYYLALSVVGNKSDLEDKREVSTEKGEEFAYSLGASFTEASAATNTGNEDVSIFIQICLMCVKLAEVQLVLFGMHTFTYSSLQHAYIHIQTCVYTVHACV